MNYGINYVSICRTLVFVSHRILPDHCTAEANAQTHDHCQSTCRPFLSNVFAVFFHWMRPSNVYCWRSSCLDLGTTRVIIPQLISDPVSNTHQISIWSPPTLLHHKFTSDRVSQTHQMPRVVKWFKCPCHSITCSVYNILSQVGRFAYKHIRLMSRLLSLQPCCPHDEYTLISRSVRLISILLLIIPGYFFVVVAPARCCPGSFL